MPVLARVFSSTCLTIPAAYRLWLPSLAGRLPATQDYVVSVVPADEGGRYELTVTLR